MAITKVGGYSIPRYDFQTALENIEVLVNDFNGEIKNQDNFAQAIGHSTSSSGAYSRKRGDLKKFGLVDSGWNATDLAQRLVHPKSKKEKKNAKFEALQNIKLLEELYDYTDGEKPEEDFWIKVSEVADTTPAAAKEVVDKVESLYREMLRYESDEEVEPNNEKASNKSNRVNTSSSIPEEVKLRMIDSEGNKFDVREPRDLNVAEAFYERAIGEVEEGEVE
jgi:hypothetical protein